MSEQNYWTRLRTRRISRRTMLGASAKAGVGAAGLALVGCGDDDDDDDSAAPAAAASAPAPAAAAPAEQAAEQAQAEPAPAEQAQAAPAPTPPAAAAVAAAFDGEGDYAGEGAFDWRVDSVDEGVKPDLVLKDGQAFIAYMLERQGDAGYVRVASGTPGAFQIDDLQRGYFYGPLDIEVSPQGTVAVGYHNHDWEDGAVAVQTGDGWELRRISDPGHDGWDSALAFGPDDGLNYLGVDPAQFGGTNGVEFASFVNGNWKVTPIGSGAQPYEWGTDIAIDAQGGLHAVYFDAGNQDLVYATNAGGGWQSDSIYTKGDAGRFAVLDLASDGTPHVAFFQSDDGVNPDGASPGAIVYGTLQDGAWDFTQVGEVGDDHVLGFEDARRSVAIALHNDQPIVAWIDRARLSLASNDGGGWSAETVLESGGQEFQVVGLARDEAGAPHFAFSTVTHGPLDGDVWYVQPVARG